MSRAELARALARGETPDRIDVLKRNRARCVGIVDGAVLKVFLRDPRQAHREARALRLAAKRGISVPELLESGPDWIATRFLAVRASRSSATASVRWSLQSSFQCRHVPRLFRLVARSASSSPSP